MCVGVSGTAASRPREGREEPITEDLAPEHPGGGDSKRPGVLRRGRLERERGSKERPPSLAGTGRVWQLDLKQALTQELSIIYCLVLLLGHQNTHLVKY